MASFKNQAIIGFVAVIVLGGGYLFFFSGNGSTSASVTETTANSAQDAFTTMLAQLRPIVFDTSVLSDPRFLSLVDITTAITGEPEGRTDPFAPPGAGN
ncbi:MAG: hypothetical protein KGI41_01945 [Patescibacteria group bacterium]|nr:hypothetical protein [Patescibacteria group bacterium]